MDDRGLLDRFRVIAPVKEPSGGGEAEVLEVEQRLRKESARPRPRDPRAGSAPEPETDHPAPQINKDEDEAGRMKTLLRLIFSSFILQIHPYSLENPRMPEQSNPPAAGALRAALP